MKVIRCLDKHIEEYLLVILSATMVLVIFLQVVMRYVLGSSLSWSEELARYCFIWSVYIGISYGVKRKRHISVDVLLVMLKERGRLILTILTNCLFIIFATIIIYYGADITIRLLSWGQDSPALQIPMGVVYLAAPVGLGLCIIRLMQDILFTAEKLKNKIT
ncbi:TRAP transporter small permease [Virgibacillus pantothenticus]|uniref:C4-dicarboxylate ABC transporter n=1 Tax=Virgibacillus pantothenticus TaxID=1473 RepID=A0A0L0QLJ0_VIRPA|nr:TRAP transporter small permease [Virgibacillus pantothenticus]API93091.1 TRAP transporter small permease protein [Virgibacillus sp. 6R]MBS7427043.1 TRAP transporter small permease [Virgibacillus sp. 19R1-5]KNE19389.1 C4-dicarboxylate ABC transporter [Virgibacillus pantothenticus]MBU8568738.1 TRAP transporter small permease [Virgibacillus pantothenticus]MBU8602731.1 TRAP transporter small permease [Virgibacillus pantothenticus]